VVREAIGDYCNAQPGMAVVVSEPTAELFLTRASSETVPQVVLMDIGLPGMSGIQAIRIIKERFPHVNILMLTVYMDSQKIFDSLCAGASGYLLKTTPFPQLVESIFMIQRGGAPMSPQIARKVIEYFQAAKGSADHAALTPREQEVVVGLVDGLSYKQIAQRLGVSIETVRSHIKMIYSRLHVHGKAEVIRRSLTGKI
jgi:DNA-binding NarL/FixJ family response regulator